VAVRTQSVLKLVHCHRNPGSNVLQRRYVDDPTTGQPVIWYEGTGVAATDRRYLSQDERGSVISVSDSGGASLGINTMTNMESRPPATSARSNMRP
jgi:hypothetical protein